MTIQRWRLGSAMGDDEYGCLALVPAMVKDDNGECVRFADHQEQLNGEGLVHVRERDSLRARIAELEKATEGLVEAIRVSRFDPASINRAVAVGRAALSPKEPE